MACNISRRQFSWRGILSASVMTWPSIWSARLFGEETESNSFESLGTPETEAAVGRGLEYLAELQQENGTFGRTDFSRNVGVCSLAGMAFLAAGSTPSRGKFGQNMQRCVDYALASVRADGFIRTDGAVDRRPMYGHGFATMLLCLTHGMTKASRENRSKIVAAVKTILNTQNDAGGWRYEPQRADADISVTACQMTALRAAKNAGFYVPRKTVEDAAAFVESCQNKDGGFSYQRNEGESEWARSAAAIVSLYGAGIYSGSAIENGLAYLHRASKIRDGEEHEYFYYGLFYTAQVMWQAGGEHWKRWFPPVRETLIRLQKPNGSWIDPVGPAYATSVALIVLQMENGYIPLFQK